MKSSELQELYLTSNNYDEISNYLHNKGFYTVRNNKCAITGCRGKNNGSVFCEHHDTLWEDYYNTDGEDRWHVFALFIDDANRTQRHKNSK